MWTSLDAINAEVQYRREHVQRESRTRSVGKRRAARKRRAAEVERRKAQRAERATGEPARHQSDEAALPAQRTPGSGRTTKQPV